MCWAPPTPGTLPFPLGSLPNPLLPRVTSLGPGTRCFIFNSPPLPLGELHERREGRPLGCSLLLCPSAQPVSFMLRLPSLQGVSVLPACPPFPSWPVFCLEPLFQFRLFGSSISFLPYQLSAFTPSSSPPSFLPWSSFPLLSSSQASHLPSSFSSTLTCSPSALVPWWPLTWWSGPPSLPVPSGSDRELGVG